MRNVPIAFIYSRLFIGVFLFSVSFLHWQHFNMLAIVLFTMGLLSDILDGIVARRLGISTQKLRRLDSSVDQIFWCLIAAAAFVQCPDFFYHNYIQLSILLAVEALTYLVSFMKFKKEVATHAISSKIWVLLLFATLVQVMAVCNSSIIFQLCFYVGIITRLEIICILFILKAWANDVPSVYHAIQLRRGKAIKRNKLFNG